MLEEITLKERQTWFCKKYLTFTFQKGKKEKYPENMAKD